MTGVAKGALWLLAVLVVVFIGFRVVRPREGTRSVSIRTSVAVLRNPTIGARTAASAAKTRCTDLNSGLKLLGVRGPATVVVRESAPTGASTRFTVDCATHKVSLLGD